MVKVLSGGVFCFLFLSFPCSFQPETFEVCGNRAADICRPWALSQAAVIVVVAALSQADFLPAVPGYSWAVSPQPRNASLAGRPTGSKGGTYVHSQPVATHGPFSPRSVFQAPGSSTRARETMVSVTMGESVVFSLGSLSPLSFLRYDLGEGRRGGGGRARSLAGTAVP